MLARLTLSMQHALSLARSTARATHASRQSCATRSLCPRRSFFACSPPPASGARRPPPPPNSLLPSNDISYRSTSMSSQHKLASFTCRSSCMFMFMFMFRLTSTVQVTCTTNSDKRSPLARYYHYFRYARDKSQPSRTYGSYICSGFSCSIVRCSPCISFTVRSRSLPLISVSVSLLGVRVYEYFNSHICFAFALQIPLYRHSLTISVSLASPS